MQAEFKHGPNAISGGVLASPWLGTLSQVITAQAHARYYTAVARGKVFIAGTAAAGVAPGTAVSTTPPFILYNPSGSGINLSVLRASMGYISGTLGAGTVYFQYNSTLTQAAPSGGTALTEQNALVGSALTATGQAFQGSTLAATPVVLRPAWSLTALLATTAVQPYVVECDVNGEIVVAPGAAISLQATAAGGATPLVAFGMTWEEVTI